MVLTKLEAIHEKLIRLKVVGPMKIKMNFYFIIGIIVYFAANIQMLAWMTLQTVFEKIDMVINNHWHLNVGHKFKINVG